MANRPIICAGDKFREADPGATIAPEHLGLHDLVKAGDNVKIEYNSDGTITLVSLCCDETAPANNDGITIGRVEFVPNSGGAANGVIEGERATLRVHFSEALKAPGHVSFVLSGQEYIDHPTYYASVQAASPVAVLAGATHVDIGIQTIDDTIDELTKVMNVALAFNGSTSNTSFDVLDNDDAPLVCKFFATFTAVSSPVEEGQVARFRLTLTEPYPGVTPTTFPVVFSGSHTESNPSAYQARSIVVQPGVQTVDIEVPVHRDGLTANNTTKLRATIFAGMSGCPQVQAPFVEIDITNTDAPQHPSLMLERMYALSAQVTEGQTINYLLRFFDNNNPTPYQIPYRYEGTEKDAHPTKYPSGVINIPAHAAEHTVSIVAFDDTNIEPTTVLDLVLWPDEPQYRRSAAARILDNDSVSLPDILRITSSPRPVNEGGTICYKFERINPHLYSGSLTLALSFSGSEVQKWPNMPPYPTPNITLPNGNSTATHCVTLYSDGENTGNRRLNLSATAVNNSVITGSWVVEDDVIDSGSVVVHTIEAFDDVMEFDAGGGQSTLSVLANDRVDGGPAQGRVVPQMTNATTGGIIINNDGTVSVNAGVPQGSHELTYVIQHPTSQITSQAKVTVRKRAPVVAPVEDVLNVRYVLPGTDTDVTDILAGQPVDVLITMPSDGQHNVQISWIPNTVDNYFSGAISQASFSGTTHRFSLVSKTSLASYAQSVDVRVNTVGSSIVRQDSIRIHQPMTGVNISAASGSTNIEEGQLARWVFTRSQPMPVDYTYTAELSGTEQSIHNYPAPSVVLRAGETSVNVNVQTTDDSTVEPTQSLILRVSGNGRHVESQIDVRDNDTVPEQPYTLTVSAPPSVQGGQQITWTITVSRPVEGTPLVLTGDWTGTETTDTFNYTIPVGQSSATFTTNTNPQGTQNTTLCLKVNSGGRVSSVNHGGGGKRCVDILRRVTYRVVSVTAPTTVNVGDTIPWTITLDRPVEGEQLFVSGTWSGTHIPPSGNSFGYHIPVGQSSVTFNLSAVGASNGDTQCLTLSTSDRIVSVSY